MMQNPYVFKGSLVFSLVNVQNFEFESGDVQKISFQQDFMLCQYIFIEL